MRAWSLGVTQGQLEAVDLDHRHHELGSGLVLEWSLTQGIQLNRLNPDLAKCGQPGGLDEPIPLLSR